jgi:virulence factor Mce-like protein
MPALRWRGIYKAGATALIATALVGVGGACAQRDGRAYSADYCAIMPDSVGLYADNPVTQMGYEIGKVKSINPSSNDVRVDFTVTAGRRLPRDVKAVIRSTSILADRSLELVGNYQAGPRLPAGGCIPLTRSVTPKSLSEVIGSATNFINTINPNGSKNVGGVVRGIDEAFHNNGAGVRQLLTTSSAVLDSPDQAVSDIASIIANLAQLTSMLAEIRGPLKEILIDAHKTTADIFAGVRGGTKLLYTVPTLERLVSDIETKLGDDVQFTLDGVAVALRKMSAHAPWLANLLNPVPWWINTLANHVNNRQYNTLGYRLPLYRIHAPDGLALCNIMNASTPGSCANVEGQPYAVDVALLQYVLTQAAHR